MVLASIFIPHGHCYLWQPELVRLHIISDGLTAIAYYSIPFTLTYIVEKRRDIPYNWIFLLFGAFIVLCGTTHIFEIWTLWHPNYWLSGFTKAITALVSLYTAVVLVKLVPQVLEIPSAAQFEAVKNEIAERQRVEVELNKAKETAEAANRSKSRFLASMSHELRTPLNSILGFAQILHRDNSLSPECREYINIINRSGQHLLELINDVLEMSKIEAGRVKLSISTFDIYRLIENLEEMLHLKAASKQLMLTFDCASSVPQYISTDESKLRQILLNLLSNAIKFTESGSVTLRVRLRTGNWELGTGKETTQSSIPNRLSLYFEVADTGPGIDPIEMNLLFEAFEQTSTGRKTAEGTGLGLPISRFFVNLMGGEMTVSSVVGEGSVFAFNIQVEVPQITQVQTELFQKRVKSLTPNQPAYKLLIVDDTWEHRQLLRSLLKSLGFEVKEAETAQQGIEIWESWKPNLIFMDMRMPVMNGYEATQHIKATPLGQATVIIALTATAFNDERALTLEAGCDDFIRKPFQEEEIFDKLAKHLGVSYVYFDCTTMSQTSQKRSTRSSSLEQDLAVMPEQWVHQLYEAASGGSDEHVLKLIAEIPTEYATLIENLQQLTSDFRFDEIVNAINQE
ncbi:response regulator [Scytonema sp. UIC 10036]|uniref:response regulator n=1 Tax=Scytonema sp. UIC 10036 TaxID=2304196 RepID=UPI0012DA2043|nr:response regulator [Scytonema sp. UIC 10036]MUG98894.1 response regulator [Scytonema sp. UIC 10036]